MDWETFPTYERTSPRTDSDAVMTTIQGCIDDCLGPDHGFCTKPADAELPSRALEVGVDNSTIRLIEPRGKVTRYICLSHCWGNEQIITTKKSTIKERMAAIKMEDLSKTFQDAVILTRLLRVQYIWIDSLCIVEDDVRDWKHSPPRCATFTARHISPSLQHLQRMAGVGYFVRPLISKSLESLPAPMAVNTAFSSARGSTIISIAVQGSRFQLWQRLAMQPLLIVQSLLELRYIKNACCRHVCFTLAGTRSSPSVDLPSNANALVLDSTALLSPPQCPS